MGPPGQLELLGLLGQQGQLVLPEPQALQVPQVLPGRLDHKA